jgi:hypothetical protein
VSRACPGIEGFVRLKVIGCDSLARLVYHCAAHSPHTVDLMLFPLGLHVDPADLRARLQAQIDASVGQGYDALLLGYGLCGQATQGLVARDVPLVIPRAHDCITLFLGSRERYEREFRACPGTYWYILDYVERRNSAGTALSLGSTVDTDIDGVYEEYVRKYGQDNADYLMEVMGAWQQHYQRAVLIDLGIGDTSAVEASTRAEAERRGWTFDTLSGDPVLIRKLLYGEWDDDFLILQPGQQIAMALGREVITACPKSAG